MRMFIGLSKTFSKIFASKAEQPAKPSKPASKATECAARKEPADYKLIFSTIEDEHSDIEDEVLRKLAILEDQYDVAIKATPTRGGSRGKGSRPGGKDMKGVAKFYFNGQRPEFDGIRFPPKLRGGVDDDPPLSPHTLCRYTAGQEMQFSARCHQNSGDFHCHRGLCAC